MNIFCKEFGTAMLVLLIVFAAVLAVCGIATLITKLMKKDVTLLTKILAGVFGVIFLVTTIFDFVQVVPAIKADKSILGTIVGGKLIAIAIALMIIILMVENTKNHWLGFVLAILPAGFSIYSVVVNFKTLGAYADTALKVEGYTAAIGKVLIYVAIMVFGFLTLVKVIKTKKQAFLFAMIPAIVEIICFAILYAFTAKSLGNDLVIPTVFDALRRALMVIWCYAMVAKSGSAVAAQAVAPQAAPQPMPNPMSNPQPMVQPVYQNPQGFQPQQPTFQAQQPVQQPVQPVMQPQQPVQPAAPVVDNAPKFDPVTGQPINLGGAPTETLAE